MHGRVRCEHGLNFAQLDSVAADLDLMIEPAQEFDLAVFSVTHKVARAIEPHSGLSAERIRDEPLVREIGTVQISSRDTLTANEQLARDADRDGARWRSRI